MIIGLAAISHCLLHHFLTSSKFDIRKTQFEDEKRNQDDSEPPLGAVALPEKSRKNELLHTQNAVDALEWRNPILGDVMQALADPNTHLFGVYDSDDVIKERLREIVYRKVQRDKMFGKVVRPPIPKKPELRKIQKDIARELGLTFKNGSEHKRADELTQTIKKEQSILIVLCGDVYKEFNLSKVGIPYGADHEGCKVLLITS
ncbi:hypothetical protein QN277_005836 [Acacia crassicarpa]|nr:hypothetical protein QN277_005836 [Acacia crassicarpa]